jgi:hypothetical protein
MKALFSGLIFLGLSILLTFAGIRSRGQSSPAPSDAHRTPVVVELFTSEGCSSCPPADALLAGLELQQPVEGAQVIALEEHVDYWNELGWVDPFSSHGWTTRQYVYSEILGNGNPYTPQMVVDGRTEFVGNQSRKARQTIAESARAERTQVTLLRGNADKPGEEHFSVKIGKLPGAKQHDTAEVWLAITETGLHSAVKRGENAGEDLHHAAIVRSIQKIGEAKAGEETSFAGEVNAAVQAEWKRENLKAVVFVQEKKGRRILGAGELPVAR